MWDGTDAATWSENDVVTIWTAWITSKLVVGGLSTAQNFCGIFIAHLGDGHIVFNNNCGTLG